MPLFSDNPIQQDEKRITTDFGVQSNIEDIRPLKDKILGKRLVTFEHDGLIFYEELKEPHQGKIEVIAVGPKVTEVKPGDVVMIGQYRDMEFGSEEKYLFFQEADVRVIFDKDGSPKA